MKEFLVLLVCVTCMVSSAFAQQDTKLSAAFSEEELSDLSKNDLDKLAFLKFKANECYQVQDLSGKKNISDLPDISALNALAKTPDAEIVDESNFDKDQFNPLLYSVDTEVQPAYYRVGDSGVLIKIFTEKRCLELFKK